MKEKINVGIIGGTGYTGGELCRILLNHPKVDYIFPTARENASFERVHRNLIGSGLKFTDMGQLEKMSNELDVVFFCTPTGEAMQKAPYFLDRDVKVIDLSADFRFKNHLDYEKAHGKKHLCPELLKEAVYGVSEINREEIKKARLVANPGCYVITSILGAYPLMSSDLVDLSKGVHISAINGTSGAENKPKKDILHAEVSEDILPYNMEGHRHSFELEDQLEKISGQELIVNFNTAHGPFARGIYANTTIFAKERYKRKINRELLLNLYKTDYGNGSEGEFFVRVNDFPKIIGCGKKEYDVYPHIKDVRGSNFCQIGLDYDLNRGIIKIISVTDNLIKGAAGSAIQNMNLIMGFDEKEGLKNYGF